MGDNMVKRKVGIQIEDEADSELLIKRSKKKSMVNVDQMLGRRNFNDEHVMVPQSHRAKRSELKFKNKVDIYEAVHTDNVSTQKIDLGHYSTNQPDLEAPALMSGMRICTKCGHSAADQGSSTQNDRNENNQKERSKYKIDPEVKILNAAQFSTADNSSCFVPSKIHHEHFFPKNGRLNVCSEFRRQVFDVLRKPYDRNEYMGLLEAAEKGSYFQYYPDLKRKFEYYQCKKVKRLNILRGFFFWLQHVPVVGAFRPWKDRECLAVKPASL